jgi:acyl-CoA thioester hydrolase
MEKENRTAIKVRYSETDRMGIVHHSRYFPWFEVGRSEFIAAAGMTYSQVEEAGLLFPLIESGAKYIEGAVYEDDLIIRTVLAGLGKVRCRFEYEVIRVRDQKTIATGFTEHAFVDASFHPVNAKKKFPKIWSILDEAKLEELPVRRNVSEK